MLCHPSTACALFLVRVSGAGAHATGSEFSDGEPSTHYPNASPDSGQAVQLARAEGAHSRRLLPKMGPSRTHYHTLGVPTTATTEEIKHAFRRLARCSIRT